MNVSIVIINYNTMQMTSECIHSIVDKTEGVSYEIILVDNASTDGSKEVFQVDPRIRYIYCTENLGFGRANNIGMNVAQGKYIFLLNSDTLLLNNAVKYFFDYAEQDDKLAIYGAWLLDKESKVTHSYGQFPTIWTELHSALRVYTSRLRWFPQKDVESQGCNVAMNVDYITGAAMFIPCSVYKQIGGFNEAYFLYYEETEWEKRMSLHQIDRIIIPYPKIMHYNGGSQSTNSNTKSMRKTLNSTDGMLLYIKSNTSILLYIVFRVMYFTLRFLPILFSEYKFVEKKAYIRKILK